MPEEQDWARQAAKEANDLQARCDELRDEVSTYRAQVARVVEVANNAAEVLSHYGHVSEARVIRGDLRKALHEQG